MGRHESVSGYFGTIGETFVVHKRQVDFIKLDIEGAEYDVLSESRDKIGSVSAITLEYHQNARNLAGGTLERTLEILSDAGFGRELFYQARPMGLNSLPNDSVYQLIIKATK